MDSQTPQYSPDSQRFRQLAHTAPVLAVADARELAEWTGTAIGRAGNARFQTRLGALEGAMKRSLLLLATTIVCLGMTGCGGKPVFYKPGATAADFEQAKMECEYEATKHSYTPMGRFDSPIMSGMQGGMQYNKLLFMCLQVKGWRPVQQDETAPQQTQPDQLRARATVKGAQDAAFSPALAKWEELAEQGDAHAQFKLGTMYFGGLGVTSDRQKGCDLIRTAADQGNQDALSFYNRYCPSR